MRHPIDLMLVAVARHDATQEDFMSEAFELEAYLERIAYHGPTAPDLATLAAIHQRHVSAIPFENLDPLVGHRVRLDLASLQAKLVRSRRGGYCFEQNSLLKGALEALGFRVTGLAARVRWLAPPERPLGPRAHMLLKVDLPDGPYIADVGFGAHLLDAPLKLQADAEQPSPAALYRLTSLGDSFMLAARLPAGWQPMYVFGVDAQVTADYELSNWYTSTSPQVWFTKRLLVERLTGAARYTLSNRRLVERQRGGEVRERTLSSAVELGEVLDQVFNLAPPVSADSIFARLGDP
jgi:N-hydroxyarylamine O-acetyltransferase